MSGIAAVFRLDGEPADVADVNRLLDAMAYWGPDRRKTVQSHAVAMGHLLLKITADDEQEDSPAWTEDHRLLITADARLYNRDELARRLGISPSRDAETLSDSEYLRRTLQRFGEEGLHHLVGDYAFAMWDEPRSRFVCGRGPLAYKSLYYTQRGNTLAVCSSLRALALWRYPDSPKINQHRILEYLVAMAAHDGETFFEDVFYLPTGRLLTGANGGVHIATLWSAEQVPDVRLRRRCDYVDGLRDLVNISVESRLRSVGQVGVSLSGGLDSGAVAVVAARALRRETRVLKGYCAVPAPGLRVQSPPGRVGNEQPLVERLAQQEPNLKVSFVSADGWSPLTEIERDFVVFGEPIEATINRYWLYPLREQAELDGVKVLLVGAFGNGAFSWAGTGLLQELLCQGDLLPVAAHLRALARDLGRSWLRLLAGTLIPPSVRMAPRRWLARVGVLAPPWQAHASLRRGLLQERAIWRRMRSAGYDPWFRAGRGPRENMCGLIDGSEECFLRSEALASNFGIEYRDPLADRRLVEYLLGCPQSVFMEAGWARLVARDAQAGVLPDQIRWSRVRGIQAADACARLCEGPSESLLRGLRDRMDDSFPILRDSVDTEKWRSEVQLLLSAGWSSQVGNWALLNCVLRPVFLDAFLSSCQSRPTDPSCTGTRSCDSDLWCQRARSQSPPAFD